MFCRHDRVWLSSQGWARACDAAPNAQAISLTWWADRGWPAIVRRTHSGIAADTICIGLPLPPEPSASVKIRIPLVVSAADIERHEPPLLMKDAEAALPEVWKDAYANLAQAAALRQMNFHVYGSVAMQATTGLPYLNETSDIDLLFYPDSPKKLREGLNLLVRFEQLLPLDGEIVFPSGSAVAWKEWLQAIASASGVRVMAKKIDSVNLMSIPDLLGEFTVRA